MEQQEQAFLLQQQGERENERAANELDEIPKKYILFQIVTNSNIFNDL